MSPRLFSATLAAVLLLAVGNSAARGAGSGDAPAASPAPAVPAAPVAPVPAAPARTSSPAVAHPLSDTRCALCHSANGWRQVTFDHTRTGFILRGVHAKVACSACHGADLSRAVPQTCAACHRDTHVGEFGARCQGCHEETSWKPLFTADAHRRTNFPLNGRHAFIACEECHTNQRDRSFTRSTVDCISCHQSDYARTAGSSIDHAAAGFPTTCRDCHLPYRWQGAHFAEHATCFEINAGPHANIRCTECHTAMPNVVGASGACNTNSASCTRCHSCNSVDARHASVGAYQCKDRKCWECHRFSNAQFPRAPGQRGLR